MSRDWPRLVMPSSLAGALVVSVLVHAAAPIFVSFETVPTGSLPPGFRILTSANANPGRWQVEQVEGTAALAHVSDGGPGYQVAVLDSPQLAQLRLGVRVRMGPGERAAGLAWRVRDGSNYYAARLDLDEREFVLYKFARGNRIALEHLSNLRLDVALWHDLTIEHVGERLRVWLNGIPVATERDRSHSEPGMFGLWLPSDSTASFSRLWYEPVERD